MLIHPFGEYKLNVNFAATYLQHSALVKIKIILLRKLEFIEKDDFV
jgi:hypothetical protein